MRHHRRRGTVLDEQERQTAAPSRLPVAPRAARSASAAAAEGGPVWVFEPSPTGSPLNDVWALGGGTAYAVGEEATIFSNGFESGDTSAWSGSVP